MNAPLQQLTCPKCRGAMNSYERSGVVIDQCSECRGIFLDRGELERLIDLDAASAAPAATPAPAPAHYQPGPEPDRSWRPQPPQAYAAPQRRQDWDDDSDSHRRHPGLSGHRRPKKKHSLLKELLDF